MLPAQTSRFPILSALFLALGVAFLALPSAKGAILLWDIDPSTAGAKDGSGTWVNGGATNWLSAGTNVAWNNSNNDTAAFGDGVTTAGSFTVTVSGSVTAGGITFNQPASSNAPLYTLSGGTITLASGSTISNAATTNTALHTISSALFTTGTVTISGRRFWMNNSSFSGGGTLNIATQDQLLFQNGGALNGLSVINLNSGGIDIRASTGGSGYNYASGTTLNVNFNNAGINTNSITTAGTVVNWMGDIVVQNGNTLQLTPQSANTSLRISGVISDNNGSGNLRINANSGAVTTTILSGANTYSGTTLISSGTLQVGVNGVGSTGTGAVTVQTQAGLAGTTLAGSGTVRGATTVANLAALRPGDDSGVSIGTLTFTNTSSGSLTLATGSNTYFTLAGATGNDPTPFDGIDIASLLSGTPGAHDHIDIFGGLVLNANSKINVSLASGYSPVLGDVFNLFDWGLTSGALTANAFNLSTDLVLESSANMIANGWFWATDQFISDGLVYVVPEPGKSVLLWLALMAMCLRRRRA